MSSPESKPRPDRPESPASKETFPHRPKRPGEAGLAHEARPGLGSREGDDDGTQPLHAAAQKPTPQDHEPQGRNAPLTPKAPREQKSDSRAQAEEHDTGMSGQSSGT